MKRLIGLAIALGISQQMAVADHAQLRTLSRQLSVDATRLVTAAREVIGYYPTYRQRYAYEHVSFLHNSAHRFERIVLTEGPADDHAHDQLIVRAYRQLERDTYYARSTLGDLFACCADSEGSGVTDDHSSADLGQMLSSCERLVQDIYRNLPTQ